MLPNIVRQNEIRTFDEHLSVGHFHWKLFPQNKHGKEGGGVDNLRPKAVIKGGKTFKNCWTDFFSLDFGSNNVFITVIAGYEQKAF